MTTGEIQLKVFEMSGLKTSVRKGTGSMKGYFIVSPNFQGGEYPKIPRECWESMAKDLKEYDNPPNDLLCGYSNISVYGIVDSGRINYKREKRNHIVDDGKPIKGWGSKNSQIRLDKASARNGKRLKAGTTARYN